MKNLGLTLLALGVVAGCSDAPKTIDTSGSHPTLGTTAAMTPEAKDAEVDTGRLLVLTPRIPEQKPLDLGSSPLTRYSGYTVYTENGHEVAHEENHAVRVEGPVERRLAPGRYFVRLDQERPGRDFWVTIERGRVTRVENRLWNEPSATVK
jgi:hypothetical protein